MLTPSGRFKRPWTMLGAAAGVSISGDTDRATFAAGTPNWGWLSMSMNRPPISWLLSPPPTPNRAPRPRAKPLASIMFAFSLIFPVPPGADLLRRLGGACRGGPVDRRHGSCGPLRVDAVRDVARIHRLVRGDLITESLRDNGGVCGCEGLRCHVRTPLVLVLNICLAARPE